MDLLVASLGDPAGVNMARELNGGKMPSEAPSERGGFEIMAVPGPVVEADAIEASVGNGYDGIVFLSRHAAKSGKLALTCHSTGNFGPALLGGRDSEVAVPHSQLIRRYIGALWARRAEFEGFDVTLEATHHGPTALSTPSAFVEVGTGPAQWNDASLCSRVARILKEALLERAEPSPGAVCFGGGHYPSKFTAEAVSGRYAVGTIVPGHALGRLDQAMLLHILERNPGARTALLDSDGMGGDGPRVSALLADSGLEVVEL